jgi:anti-sigma regulatory factor (Ser/Thr protein kinase)
VGAVNLPRGPGHDGLLAWEANLDRPASRQPGHVLHLVAAEADVAALRRAVAGVAEVLCPGGRGHGRAELVATELGTNLLRHAEPGGWVLVRPVAPHAVEMIAVDRGPGITDVAAVLAGRVATPAGLGCGVGSVRRASSVFDLHSGAGGTVVLAVVDLAAAATGPDARPPRPRRSWAGVSVGITEPCGDGWAVAEAGDTLAVAVVDGLGHGLKASQATDAALAEFAAAPTDLAGFTVRANAQLRETRGAAVTLCRLDARAREVTYLGVGNVNGRVVTADESRGLVTYSGTLGLQLEPPRVRMCRADWGPGATLALWTDGLSTRVRLTPGDDLLAHDPAVVAAVLHRDHGRNRDDATAVVVRFEGTT